MKMESTTLKFDPQVMALAMPTESGFTKGAEGIDRIGKLFDIQEDRAQAQQLNALKMDEAKLSIEGKRFDNSIAGEKWENEKTTSLLERRNKTLDGLKKQMDLNAEVKKAEESGALEKLKGMIPKAAYTNADGKPDRQVIGDTRAAFLATPEWQGKGHIVNAAFDGLEADIFKDAKTQTDLRETEAKIAETKEKTKWIAPEKQANINQSNASAANSYASANKHNVDASLAPREVRVKEQNSDTAVQTEKRLSKQTTAVKDRTERAKLFDELTVEDNFPGYEKLTDNDKMALRRGVLKTGDVPMIVPIEKGDNFADKSATHKIVWNDRAALSTPQKKQDTTIDTSSAIEQLRAAGKK